MHVKRRVFFSLMLSIFMNIEGLISSAVLLVLHSGLYMLWQTVGVFAAQHRFAK